MSAIATAIVGGAVISGLASNSAASTQADAANNATATQQGMFNTTQANLQPYMGQGSISLSSLMGKINNGQLGGTFTGQDYLNNQDPGYGFQFQQGLQGLQNSQAAQDGVLSGSALKGLLNYNQGMAATGYQNAYNRWLSQQANTSGQLMNVANIGENAAAGLGNTGAQYASSIGSSMMNAGNASAAGTIGTANAITGSINNGLGYYQLNQMLGNQTNTADPSAASQWGGSYSGFNNPSNYG